MTRLVRIIFIILALAFLYLSVAVLRADAVTTKTWAPLNITPALKIPQGAFSRLTGWPGQSSGPAFYTYVKGSRSRDRHLPESWYVHQGGKRVMDGRFNSFVMDPTSPGWQGYVIRQCPVRCYVDGVGVTSLSRTVPHLNWSRDQWVAAVVSELRALGAAGIDVVPNSIGLQSATAYLSVTRHATSEAIRLGDRSTWVIAQAGHVWVDGHTGQCGRKLAAYLMVRGPGDLFHCAAPGTGPGVLPAALRHHPVGPALSGPRTTAGVDLVRRFRYATVTVYADGSYRIAR